MPPLAASPKRSRQVMLLHHRGMQGTLRKHPEKMPWCKKARRDPSASDGLCARGTWDPSDISGRHNAHAREARGKETAVLLTRKDDPSGRLLWFMRTREFTQPMAMPEWRSLRSIGQPTVAWQCDKRRWIKAQSSESPTPGPGVDSFRNSTLLTS